MPTGPNDPDTAYPPAAPSADVLMSERRLYKVSGSFAVTEGEELPQSALLTDALEFTGEDYHEVPGSALPLAMTVVDGLPTYPAAAEDHIFDVQTVISYCPATADVGKVVIISVAGNDGRAEVVCPVIQTDVEGGSCFATFNWVDRIFRADTEAVIRTRIYTAELTEPAWQPGTLSHLIVQR